MAENTILLFLTDNGTAGSWGVYYAGMRGIKGSVYDGGHRVPCFLYWPAKGFDTARDIEVLSAHIDILPTLIDLCDLKTPATAKHAMSGRSWLPLLEEEGAVWQDRALFVHCQNAEHYEKWKNSAVITSKWRLVNRDELYEIKADPAQEADDAKANFMDGTCKEEPACYAYVYEGFAHIVIANLGKESLLSRSIT